MQNFCIVKGNHGGLIGYPTCVDLDIVKIYLHLVTKTKHYFAESQTSETTHQSVGKASSTTAQKNTVQFSTE
ncbi:hypothetical protein KUTeg_018755, partial [Tegillarca granosa]